MTPDERDQLDLELFDHVLHLCRCSATCLKIVKLGVDTHPDCDEPPECSDGPDVGPDLDQDPSCERWETEPVEEFNPLQHPFDHCPKIEPEE